MQLTFKRSMQLTLLLWREWAGTWRKLTSTKPPPDWPLTELLSACEVQAAQRLIEAAKAEVEARQQQPAVAKASPKTKGSPLQVSDPEVMKAEFFTQENIRLTKQTDQIQTNIIRQVAAFLDKETAAALEQARREALSGLLEDDQGRNQQALKYNLLAKRLGDVKARLTTTKFKPGFKEEE